MCFDKEILKPYNQCNYTNVEYKHTQLFKLGDCFFVKMYTDKDNRQRLVIFDDTYYTQSKPVSGLFLEHLSQRKGYVIKGVYTVPEERRKGLAKLLLNVARQYLGEVRHSSDLTKEGELWMKAVEKVQ